MKKLLGWFTAALFLLGMVVLTTPHLILTVLWSSLRFEDKSAYRKRLSSWALAWGRRYLWMVQKVMRLHIDYDIQRHINIGAAFGKVPNRHPIIIANHRTVLDHCIVDMVATEYFGEKDIRWVLKSQMRRAPVVGWLMKQMGCAFVSRNRDPEDMDRIQQMASIARQDEAAVMVYPEGTRFDGVPKPGSTYTHVREPKLGGFRELCGNLQTRDVLVIIIDWGELEGGKTMWDGNAFVGRKVRVHAYPISNPHFSQAQECLEQTWADADHLIGTKGQTKASPWIKRQAR